MSDEKPNIKINDRRLFNPDGTPREDVLEEREAERAKAAEAAAASASTASAARPTAATAADAAAPSATPRGAEPPEPAPAETAGETGPAAAAPEEEEDPQEFMMLVQFIASFAAEALGMVPPSAGGPPPQIDLALARQCIDMLGTLERKTQGNLSAEQQRFLNLILSQLRMHYFQLAQQRAGGGPAAPRNFTGGDITGGR